jgi:hypothetical protein
MTVDLAALIRRHKPEQRLKSLRYRKRAELASFSDLDVRSDAEVLLDTGIYVRQHIDAMIIGLNTYGRRVTCNAWTPAPRRVIAPPAIVPPSASRDCGLSCCGCLM